jgi:hypothetical protein
LFFATAAECFHLGSASPSLLDGAMEARLLEFDPTTANQFMLVGWSIGNLGTATTSVYAPIFSDGTVGDTATEIQGTYLSPMAGTITSGSCSLGIGNSRSVAFNQNGSANSTAGTPTWSNTTGLKSFGTGSSSVAQSDYLDLDWTASGSSITNSQADWACLFTPTTAGQFPIPSQTRTNFYSTSTTWYNRFAGTAVPSTSESAFQAMLTADLHLVGFCASSSTSGPTNSKYYTFSLRENAAVAPTTFSTALQASGTISASSAACSSGHSHYSIPANYDLYDTSVAPTASPTGSS